MEYRLKLVDYSYDFNVHKDCFFSLQICNSSSSYVIAYIFAATKFADANLANIMQQFHLFTHMKTIKANTVEYEFVNCRKIIVLHNDKNYIISTDTSLLHGMIKDILEKQSLPNSIIKFANLTFKKNFEKVITFCDEVENEIPFSSEDLKYILVESLQNGICTIFNKKTLQFTDKVEVEYYDNTSHIMISEGGRNFYFNKELFINNLDYQS